MTGWSPAGPVTPKLPIKGWWATVQNTTKRGTFIDSGEWDDLTMMDIV